MYFTTDVVFHAEILRHIQKGQLFKQSLAFVYQKYVPKLPYIWTFIFVNSVKKAES